MSRASTRAWTNACRFPRVSGDEPTSMGGSQDNGKFSPRERG